METMRSAFSSAAKRLLGTSACGALLLGAMCAASISAQAQAGAEFAPDAVSALSMAESVTPPEGVIVATGSLFLVAEVRAVLAGRLR